MKLLATDCPINEYILAIKDSFDVDANLYLILELGNRDLNGLWLEFNRIIPELIVIYILKQIINGFYALHHHHILHRDIKLENIIIV
jgi:serine/threonine protein kinase